MKPNISNISKQFTSVQPIKPQSIFYRIFEKAVQENNMYEKNNSSTLRSMAGTVRHYIPNVNHVMSAQPNFILNILKNNPDSILAGGAIRSVFDNTEVQDYDFYFKTEEARIKTIDYINAHHKPVLIYNSETTNSPHKTHTYMIYGKIVQFIGLIYPTIDDLFKSFDFTTCQFALTYEALIELPGVFANQTQREFKLKIGPMAAKNAIKRNIVINNIEDPVAAIQRVEKYKSKGYTIADKEYYKIFKRAADFKFQEDKSSLIQENASTAAQSWAAGQWIATQEEPKKNPRRR